MLPSGPGVGGYPDPWTSWGEPGGVLPVLQRGQGLRDSWDEQLLAPQGREGGTWGPAGLCPLDPYLPLDQLYFDLFYSEAVAGEFHLKKSFMA